MIAARLAVAGLTLLAACSSTKLPPPIDDEAASLSGTGDFPAQVSVERPGMTCRAATKSAARALKQLGYVIDSIRTPEAGRTGEIRGTRNTGWYTGDAGDAYGAAVRIRCNDEGSTIEAATEGGFSERIEFRRDFPILLDRAAGLAQRKRTRQPQAAAQAQNAKLQVFLQPLQGAAASAIIGANPAEIGITPVRVQIRNRSDLSYRLEASRFKLISEEGARHRPIPVADAVAAAPAEWKARVREAQIPDGLIAPGQTLDGYMYLPVAAYRRAKVVLIETQSDEAEGFSVEF